MAVSGQSDLFRLGTQDGLLSQMIYLPENIIQIVQNMTLDLYVRRSSKDDEDKQIRSIPGQIDDIQRQLVDRFNLKIGKIYRESQSAFKPGRPYFNEVLKRINNGVSQGVVSWHPNRAARNYKDGGDFVQLMSEGKLKLFLTCHGYFVDSPRDKEYLMNEFTRATRDSDDKSEAVKRGYRVKLKKGYLPSGRLPEGLIHVRKPITDEMINAPDPDRFPKLKKAILKIIYDNYSPMEALEYLNNELGYLTKRTKRTGGNSLSQSGWYKLLADPILMGDLSRWKQSHHDESTPYIASFEHMLTENEYEKLQMILGRKGTRRQTRKDWPFNGIMTCGTCGSGVLMEEKWQMICPECKIKFALSKGRNECPNCGLKIEEMKVKPLHYVWVKCNKSIRIPDGSRCPEPAVRIKDFEKQVDAVLKDIKIPKTFGQWAVKEIKKLHQDDTQEHMNNLKAVDRKYAQADRNLRNLIMMRANNEIDAKEFKLMKQAAVDEKKKWEKLREKLQKHTDDWVNKMEQVFDFATYSRHWFAKGTNEQKKAVLRSLGSNLILKDKKLLITKLKPFLVLEEVKKSEEFSRITFELSNKADIATENTPSLTEFPYLLRG